ncbi:hypothetical protein EMCRGX_G023445 [Ephydatia muelleri]
MHLSKIIRKPQGIGVEYNNVADAQTGIMLFLEIQEGKEAMAGKRYCDRYPKSVAPTLRMMEFLHGRGHVVHGDSAFASVATCTALLEHSTYFSGLLKTAYKEFPRKFYSQEIAFSAQAKRGDTVTICTEKKVHGVKTSLKGCMVIMLLKNSKDGAPEPTPFQLQLRKCKRNDSAEDEDSDVEYAVEHQIMSITQYLNARDSGSKASKQNSLAGQPAKSRNSKELAKEYWALHGTAVLCKNGIQGTQDQQASVLVINLGTNTQQPIVSQQPMQFQSNTGSGNTYLNGNPQPFNVYESIAPQQPVQFQNIAGQGQMSFNTNPPPYYGENLYPHQSYLQDPYKATFPMQPNPTDNIPPPYGGNYYSTPQQPGMAIQQQPTTVPVSTAVQTPSGDNYLTLSALMTCLVLITGGWPSLLCTTAALCISYNARDDEKRGNIAAARTKANISLCLNITAVVLVTVMWSVVAIPVAVTPDLLAEWLTS